MEGPRKPLELVAIGLGSNLGDSLTTLESALTTLEQANGVRLLARSSWYRTAPVGPPQPDFLNGCATLEVSLPALAFLDLLQDTEHRFGRVRKERWGPRTLDLDLLLYGQHHVDSERLQVPHPRMRERAFVLLPLAEIAADWVDPLSGRTVGQLADQLSDLSGVEALTRR